MEGERRVSMRIRPTDEPRQRPRIAVVTTVHRWGDPRIIEREVAAYLEWDCEVHVFIPVDRDEVASVGDDHRGLGRLRVHALPKPHGRLQRLALSLRVASPVWSERPFEVVHFHDPELIPAVAWLSLWWRRTYFLYDVHEDLPLEVLSKPYLPAPLRPLVSLLMVGLWRVARALFDGFAPATEAIARRWPPERTRVLHNYPKSLFEAPAGEPLALDPNRLLFVGGLTEVRGSREMLDAVRRVRERRPALRLDLVGPVNDASLEPAVGAAVAEGWCRHTTWLPPERLAVFCRGAAVGLVPYLPVPDHLEALPTKLFEYMAMGVPILASDFPLWRALVERSGSGRVAEPTVAGLAAALEAMLADPAQLARHGERGRAAYRGGYRWETEREHLRWHLDRALGERER